jgi:hypothetical protein
MQLAQGRDVRPIGFLPGPPGRMPDPNGKSGVSQRLALAHLPFGSYARKPEILYA